MSYHAGICFWIINYLLWWCLISIHWLFQIDKVSFGRQGLWQTLLWECQLQQKTKSLEMCLEANRSLELEDRCFCYCLKGRFVNGAPHSQMFLSVDLLAGMVINIRSILTCNKNICQRWAQMVPNKRQFETSDLSWSKQSCLLQYSGHEIKRNHNK